MIVTKVLTLSEEDISKLVEAGKVLGTISKTEHDSIDKEGTELLSAVYTAIMKVVNWPVPEQE